MSKAIQFYVFISLIFSPTGVFAEKWETKEVMLEYSKPQVSMSKQEIWPFRKDIDFLDFLSDAELPLGWHDEFKRQYVKIADEFFPDDFLKSYGLNRSQLQGYVKVPKELQNSIPQKTKLYLTEYWEEHFPKFNKPYLHKALEVRLRIDRSEVQEVSKKFSMFREPKEVEKIILSELKGNKSVSVKLEKLLPEFVQDHIHSFALCEGPNCFNAALSASTGQHSVKYVSDQELLQSFKKDFIEVQDFKDLKPGDVISLQQRSGTPIHTAVYVGDDIVFTKNGYSQSSPYQFEKLETMIKSYSASPLAQERFVYRPKNSYHWKTQVKYNVPCSVMDVLKGITKPTH